MLNYLKPMLDEDRQATLTALTESRETLLNALHGVDEPTARRAPGEGRWSILDCVEHLAAAELLMNAALKRATHSGGELLDRTRESALRRRGTDRTQRFNAPEPARPTRRYATLAEATQAWEAVRAQSIAFVEGFEGEPREWMTTHPAIPGPVNCFEVLLLIAAHPRRHALQIAEIRAVV